MNNFVQQSFFNLSSTITNFIRTKFNSPLKYTFKTEIKMLLLLLILAFSI